jgi:hypothetical protein
VRFENEIQNKKLTKALLKNQVNLPRQKYLEFYSNSNYLLELKVRFEI